MYFDQGHVEYIVFPLGRWDVMAAELVSPSEEGVERIVDSRVLDVLLDVCIRLPIVEVLSAVDAEPSCY